MMILTEKRVCPYPCTFNVLMTAFDDFDCALEFSNVTEICEQGAADLYLDGINGSMVKRALRKAEKKLGRMR